MKMKKWMFCLTLCLIGGSLLSGCKKEEKGKEGILTGEFKLEKMLPEPEFIPLTNIFFHEAVSLAKVNSFGKDSAGATLGFALEEGEVEKLIKLIQEGELKGIEIDKDEYNKVIKQAVSGYMIEFTDRQVQFHEGVARMTFITAKGAYYLNLIREDGSTGVYKVWYPDNIIDFMNEKAEQNYKRNPGNPNWFNEAFNEGR